MRYMKMLRILRLGRLLKLARIAGRESVGEVVDSFMSQSSQNFIALFMKIMYFCHLLSCAWYWNGSPIHPYPPYAVPDYVGDGLCPYICLTRQLEGAPDGADPKDCPVSRDPSSEYWSHGTGVDHLPTEIPHIFTHFVVTHGVSCA